MYMKRSYIASVDIGGTKALLGLVDEEGNVQARERYLLGKTREPIQIAKEIGGRLRMLAKQAGIDWGMIRGLGCSAAIQGDVDNGIIFSAPNLFGEIRNVPFSKYLVDVTGLPTVLEMDAYAAALGEAWKGTGIGVDYFVYVVIGTGIGAGILMNAEVYRGWLGTAGEFGHTTIDPNGPICNCGRYGCLEALVSGPAIALRAQGVILQGRKTIIQELSGGIQPTAQVVFHAARAGDGVAQEIVQRTVEYLAIGLVNLIHLLNPQVISLGGGVAYGGSDLILVPLIEEVTRRCGNWIDMAGTRIVIGTLGEDAGILGAAFQVMKKIR